MRRLIPLVLTGFVLFGCSSSSSQDSVTAPPEVGTAVEETIELSLECRNIGQIEAFGLTWLMVELAPLGWRELESPSGEIRFESLERSTFTIGDETVVVSNTTVVGDECVMWP